MTTLEQWWGMYALLVRELVWAVVCLVGLVAAIRRRRRHPRAAGFAVAAFAVLLLGVYNHLSYWVLRILAEQGNEWADQMRLRIWVPYLPVIAYTVGFALLTVAIFAGRKPVVTGDPDAG